MHSGAIDRDGQQRARGHGAAIFRLWCQCHEYAHALSLSSERVRSARHRLATNPSNVAMIGAALRARRAVPPQVVVRAGAWRLSLHHLAGELCAWGGGRAHSRAAESAAAPWLILDFNYWCVASCLGRQLWDATVASGSRCVALRGRIPPHRSWGRAALEGAVAWRLLWAMRTRCALCSHEYSFRACTSERGRAVSVYASDPPIMINA